jgi:hypothetical protein
MVMSMLGLPPAPMYAERSDIENQVMHDARTMVYPEERESEVTDRVKASEEYRASLQHGDTEAAGKAKARMQELKMSEQSWKQIEKNPNLGAAERVFHRLPEKDQVRILFEARGEERAKFMKAASKAARAEVEQWIKDNPDSEVSEYGVSGNSD